MMNNNRGKPITNDGNLHPHYQQSPRTIRPQGRQTFPYAYGSYPYYYSPYYPDTKQHFDIQPQNSICHLSNQFSHSPPRRSNTKYEPKQTDSFPSDHYYSPPVFSHAPYVYGNHCFSSDQHWDFQSNLGMGSHAIGSQNQHSRSWYNSNSWHSSQRRVVEGQKKNLPNPSALTPHEPQRSQYEEQSQSDEYASSFSESYDEQQLYKRRKIRKRQKEDPEEVRKWVQMRKRNYPSQKREGKSEEKSSKCEMSLLEAKIRKKLMIINSDPRKLMRKIKNVALLRRIITNPLHWKNKLARKSKNTQPAIHNSLHYPLSHSLHQRQPMPGSIINTSMIPLFPPVQSQGEHINLDPRLTAKNRKLKGSDQAVEQPIKTVTMHEQAPKQSERGVRQQLSVQVMIAHLTGKQQEDRDKLQSWNNYSINTVNYKYQTDVLDSHFVIEDVFKESVILLQAIRYIVQNDFLQ